MELNAVYCQYRSHGEFQHSEPKKKKRRGAVHDSQRIDNTYSISKKKVYEELKIAILFDEQDNIPRYSKLIFGFIIPDNLKDLVLKLIENFKDYYDQFEAEHPDIVLTIMGLDRRKTDLINGIENLDKEGYENRVKEINEWDTDMNKYYIDNIYMVDQYEFICEYLIFLHNQISRKQIALNEEEQEYLNNIYDFLKEKEII